MQLMLIDKIANFPRPLNTLMKFPQASQKSIIKLAAFFVSTV